MSPKRKVEQVHSQQSKVFFFLHRIVLYLQASKTIISHAIHISKKLCVKIVKNEFLSSTHFQ